MKVPFFRLKSASDSKNKSKNKKTANDKGQVLEGIASESDLSSIATGSAAITTTASEAAAVIQQQPVEGHSGQSAVQAIADQMAEMERFLTMIDGFQSDARRLFPENMALGQILDELRDECRRRVDYMSRVSAPPAWQPQHQPQYQRPSSSSSTTIAAMGGFNTVGGTPGSQSSARRAVFGSTVGQTNNSNGNINSAVANKRSTRYTSAESSPVSTTTVTSNSSSSSSSGNSSRSNINNAEGGGSAYFSRHQTSASAAASTGARKPMVHLNHLSSDSNSSTPSSPSSPLPSALPLPRAQSPISSGRRGSARIADQRRKTSPQSMFVSSSTTDIASTIGIRGTAATTTGGNGNNSLGRLAAVNTGSLAKFPRTSMVVSATDSPRFNRQRTSSADVFTRPHSLVDAMASASVDNSAHNNHHHNHHHQQQQQQQQLNAKGSSNAIRTNKQRSQTQTQTQTQAHPAKTVTSDYALTIKLAGHKVEASVSSALQSSLISLQAAKMLGMAVTPAAANARVWSSAGKSWAVVGEVLGLPFVCGNMTFTHNFKAVQGSSVTGEMTRDIMLGNDFCVGYKGRIKDSQLHLEQLCMPITVPVRQIPAGSA
ncbi:hypothetical protein LPJ64_000002 [Coemansia asiatica]|uniref:Uncharacterized protein n=1 Tax=Coemansia asiatica TaxID=1052880 RepID=A0A9W7XRN0_9FUNG|nr:hypothetical protein LPJ64_000002 [Coemansia asiatica]